MKYIGKYLGEEILLTRECSCAFEPELEWFIWDK